MMKEEMLKELNKQVNAELYASYLYLSMSAWLSSKSLSGMAGWMKVQAKEEVEHAMRIYDYIIERGNRINLTSLDEPKKEWSNVLELFEDSLAHEQKVTEMIHNLVKVAEKNDDDATKNMLQWFVEEQVEEEESASDNIAKIKMIGEGDNAGLLVLDEQLGKRKDS